ncbi:MAG: DUF4912 domain-containing protein [Acaryochloridaceae cyanobacterium CSU_3_4]|nr:DUF4912 domain-containing protein [Acaryochloridaceae cyanobacterium CSU_3_4]
MSPEQLPLEQMTLRQLRRVASRYGVSRYSRMRKDQLLESIRVAQQNATLPSGKSHQGSPEFADGITAQERVEAAKFEVGQEDTVVLASVDAEINDLPDGYGETHIVLMPRDPQWAYAYWDIPHEHKMILRNQGGQQLALRLYDATDIDLAYQVPHSRQEYPCDEMAREWYVPIPVSDRDYVIEIGYRCADDRWLVLARSTPIHTPPTYPSDWVEDQFITVDWDMDLRGQQLATLVPPEQKTVPAAIENSIYDQVFGLAEGVEALRVAGSLYGSMQQVPSHESALSSYVFPSGVGLWAIPTASGLNMSGVGFSASAPPIRPRQFWMIADAELIVYGATEPDATVTIGGQPIQLNADGTFRFQMSFQDGLIDYPILAVAADGEQSRAIHMKFNRETPERRTNTKEDAVLEWLV